jgi:2-isopropylmalate synthase|tara:strand:- start:4966 stop:6582 length:1617 start_codon:yes stop_codon:yes gene_type:complete
MSSKKGAVILYDTTLRDGTQQEGISLTVKDKLDITTKLDEIGIDIIEGGWPYSNPKDEEYFQRVSQLELSHSRIAAFGSTRRAGTSAAEDPNIQALVESKAEIITIVGKTWDLHVLEVLETSLDENIAMIRDSISYLKSKSLEVHFDAEHFFDGFEANKDYALKSIQAAADAGADAIHLCDTNGGVLPNKLSIIIEEVKEAISTPLGIHVHNDGELAVANSITAVEKGVEYVQGTVNGYGERCGNANLCSIIPTLQIKMGLKVVSPDQMKKLSIIAKEISELMNMGINPSQPYVGSRAFAHKGGLHASAVAKVERSYEHMDPNIIGNDRKIVVSELAGRSNILSAAEKMGVEITKDESLRILESVKTAESEGFQYEGADASLEMLVRRNIGNYKAPFVLEDFMVLAEKLRRLPVSTSEEKDDDLLSEAMVKVRIGDNVYHTAAEGNGPVNALDEALRKALRDYFPRIDEIRLTDYKVRILNEEGATGAAVRVLIESTDGKESWNTVGSSTNIIYASWLALIDSIEYWMLKSSTDNPNS